MELLLTMKTLIYLRVLSAVLFPVLGANLKRCPHVVRQENHFVKTFRGKCYMFINAEKYWTPARKYCSDLGGDMLEVDDEGTMIFIRRVLNGRELGWRSNGVWIGANDRRKEGHWTSAGRPINYSDWSSSQPNSILGTGPSVEHCACMVRRNGWQCYDYPCEQLNWKYNFICQFPYAKEGSDTTDHTEHNPEDDNKGVIVGSILGGVGLLILIIVVVVVFICYCRRRKKKPSQDDEPPQFENLSYAQLRQAEINENNANMSCFTANQMNSMYEEENIPVDHGVNYSTNMTGAGA